MLSESQKEREIDRKNLSFVVLKSNADISSAIEREEQMRAQIAALSCEVSLSAINTVVKLLVSHKL